MLHAAGRWSPYPAMVRPVAVIAVCAALAAGAPAARAQDSTTAPVVTPAAARTRLPRVTVNILDGRDSVARGVVLQDTGRILTALTPVREARELRVVYPDGRIDRARVVATDLAWGVALLEGNAGHWVEGLRLAISDRRCRGRPRTTFCPPERTQHAGLAVGGG